LATREQILNALRLTDNDVVNAIMELSMGDLPSSREERPRQVDEALEQRIRAQPQRRLPPSTEEARLVDGILERLPRTSRQEALTALRRANNNPITAILELSFLQGEASLDRMVQPQETPEEAHLIDLVLVNVPRASRGQVERKHVPHFVEQTTT
jgi:hypothetical protein